MAADVVHFICGLGEEMQIGVVSFGWDWWDSSVTRIFDKKRKKENYYIG